MVLKIHDYDKLPLNSNLQASIATFGETKYLKVAFNYNTLLYNLRGKLLSSTSTDMKSVRLVNNYITRHFQFIMSRLSERYGSPLYQPEASKNFVTTDRQVLGIDQMLNLMITQIGGTPVEFYFDKVTEKYHIYVGQDGYCETYKSDMLLSRNNYVTDKQYTIISGLLEYVVSELHNEVVAELQLENTKNNTIQYKLLYDNKDLRWYIEDTGMVESNFFGAISDAEYEMFSKSVLGFQKLLNETGVYGLIEELNRL